MTDQIDRTEYVLLDGTGAERARGTAVEIGEKILCGNMWCWDVTEEGTHEWLAYRYKGNNLKTLPWLRVLAESEREARSKLPLAAFEVIRSGKERHLSVMRSEEFDAPDLRSMPLPVTRRPRERVRRLYGSARA